MGKPIQPDLSKEAFLSLVRLGLGREVDALPEAIDWEIVENQALQQGLSGIVADGIERLSIDKRPPKKELLQYIGLVMQDETRYATTR